MSFIGQVYKMCLDRERKAIEEEREFQMKLAVTPKTIDVNINIATPKSTKLINPIVID